MLTPDEHLARGCSGKRRYLTRKDAKRNANGIRNEGGAKMHPYWCEFCTCWHIGHNGYGTGLRGGTSRR